MPWCPKCKTEYRDGFTHCNDCGAELVDETENRPEEEKDRHARIKKEQKIQTKIEYIEEALLVNVNNEVETAYITSMLEQEGIAYRMVDEDVGQYLSIVHGRSFLGKNIYVSAEDIDKANKIMDSYKTDVPMNNTDIDKKKNFGIVTVRMVVWSIFLLGIITLLLFGVSIFGRGC